MATQAQVTQLYQELLGRAPDPGGLQHYMGYSNPTAIRNSILGSTEYRTRSTQPTPATPAPSGGAQQAYDSFVNTERQRIDQQLATQKAEQEGLFSQFESARRSQEALPALYQRLETEAGIPDLTQQAQTFKDQIYKVKGLLDRIGEDITSRTTGSLTTEAQRRRMEAAEGEDLRTQLGRLGTGLEPIAEMLSGAQSRVGKMFELGYQEQEQELEPMKMRINALSDRFARELSGYSEQREMSLTGLLDKLERERFLSDRDWQLAQQLAAEEREFARSKELTKMQLQASPVNLTPRSTATTPTAPRPAPTPLRPLPALPAPTPLSARPGASSIPLFRTASPMTSGDPLNVMGMLRR